MGLLGVGAVCGIVCGMTQKNDTKGRHKASPQRDEHKETTQNQDTKGLHKERTQSGDTNPGHKGIRQTGYKGMTQRQDTKG